MVLTKDEATKIAARAREIEGELMEIAGRLTMADCDPVNPAYVHRATEAAHFGVWAVFSIANNLHIAFDFEMPEQPLMQARAKENGQC